MTYVPRLTRPANDNKAYLKTTYGGKNHCILGNSAGRIVRGCVLPNCVGYVHGRTIELTGSDDTLCRSNAENYWGYTQDGFARSQTPKVGSIMCWRKGKAGNSGDGAGHVAFVEEVNSKGDVIVSESGWTGTVANGRYWRLRTIKRVNGTYALGVNYFFQGFIHIYEPDTIKAVPNGVYRLYNSHSSMHFFTANKGEADSLARGGWKYEGIGWKAPTSGDKVYRLYNSSDGDHLYTASVIEKEALEKIGWKYENVAFHSDKNKGVPVYRLYASHNGHMYAASEKERDALVKLGWKNEGVAFYGMK